MYKDWDKHIFFIVALFLACLAFGMSLLAGLLSGVAILAVLKRAVMAGIFVGLIATGVAQYLQHIWVETAAKKGSGDGGARINILAGNDSFVPGQIEPLVDEMIENNPERAAELMRKMGFENKH